jgi:hypothetical protein
MLREPIEFSLWDASYNGFFPEFKRVVNRCSFAVDSVSIRALDEESPVCLASRHSHWFQFWPMRNYSSTFLRSLRSRPVTALPRYSGRSDSCLPGSSASSGMNTVSIGQQVSLVHTARPSLHSVTKHLARPAIASPLPTQRGRLPGLYPGLDFTLNPQARRYARPNRVRYPTDCMFASGCSPPHLAVTQLPSATGIGHNPGGGLSPPRSRLLPGARIPAFAGMTRIEPFWNLIWRRVILQL